MALEGGKISQNSYNLQPYYSYIVTTLTRPLSGDVKQIEVALQIYDKALVQDSGSPNILTNKGIALSKIGRDGEAMDLFNKALKTDPNHAPTLFNKAILLDKMGRTDEAHNLKQRAGRN